MRRKLLLVLLLICPFLINACSCDKFDIDALRIVANGVNQLKSKDNATVVITHYQRLLDYIVPDVVHVLFDGKIVKSGPKELALELEEKGYDWIKTEYEQGLIK